MFLLLLLLLLLFLKGGGGFGGLVVWRFVLFCVLGFGCFCGSLHMNLDFREISFSGTVFWGSMLILQASNF